MDSQYDRLKAALIDGAYEADVGAVGKQRTRSNNKAKSEHRQAQLAKQAARVLSLALAESADPVLQSLDVMSVQADGACLLVMVSPDGGPDAPTRTQAEGALKSAQGYLRTALGEAISRKRVPNLECFVWGCREETRHE